jgi:hypothetical protein
MSDPKKTPENDNAVVLEYTLEATPETVWRAVTTPALREKWLPAGDLADESPIAFTRGKEVQYRMREKEPPFFESTVTFRILPGADGSTHFMIIHRLDGMEQKPLSIEPANSNGACVMRAA